MSYSSQVLALSGLVGYWPLNESAGATTCADLSPNNITLTLHDPLVQGAEQVNGLGSSLHGDGITQRAVSATSIAALNVTTAFTLGIWASYPGGLASTERSLIGRNNLYRISSSTDRIVRGAHGLTGGTWIGATASAVAAQNRRSSSTSAVTFIVFSYNGSELSIWLNGKKDNQFHYIGGSIASSTVALEILTTGGATSLISAADVSGAFMLNRAINAAECRSLYEVGTKDTLLTDGAPVDYIHSSSSAIIASNPTDGASCASCSGKRKSNEDGITPTSGNVYHDDCHRARFTGRSYPVINSSATQADYATGTSRLLWDMLWRIAKRSSVIDQNYLDPTTNLPVALDTSLADVTSASMWRSYSGAATAAAILHRYTKQSKDSWLATFAKNVINATVDAKSGTNYNYSVDGGPGVFYAVDLAQCIMLLGPVLDVTTKNRWLNGLISYCNYWVSTEKGYYTNGNINLQACIPLYIAWQVTGSTYWKTQYEYCLAFTVNAGLGVTSNAGGPGGNVAGFGWTVTTPATLADGSDGAGYFAESAGTSAGPNGVAGPGYDGDYSSYQADLCMRLYQLTGDNQYLVYMNMLLNTLLTHVNTTTWLLDATLGARHNTSFTFGNGSVQVANWHGRLANQMSAANVASHWGIAIHDYWTNNMGPTNENQIRGLAFDVAGLLWAQADWPGLPT